MTAPINGSLIKGNKRENQHETEARIPGIKVKKIANQQSCNKENNAS